MQASDGTIQRFWSKVEIQPDGCWVWTGAQRNDGYGVFSWKNKGGEGYTQAHRFAYWTTYGDIEKPELHHLCGNKLCVNPNHLDPVTRKEHMNITPGTYGYKWAQRTHCEKGHLLEEGNLLPSHLKRGARRCRICDAERQREYRQKNPEMQREANRRYKEKNRDDILARNRWYNEHVRGCKPRKRRDEIDTRELLDSPL